MRLVPGKVAYFILIALFGVTASGLLWRGTASASVPTCLWAGQGSVADWSATNNWDCDKGDAPSSGVALVFPSGVASRTTANDLSPGGAYGGLVFSGTGYTLEQRLGGDSPSQYGQIQVAGDVELMGVSLSVQLVDGFMPRVGDKFTIIDKTNDGAVTGQFTDLDQGQTTEVSGVTFAVDYSGGDGNDVVLAVQSIPGAPNTAGVVTQRISLWPAVSIVVIGLAILAFGLIKNRRLASEIEEVDAAK